jgi:hypothetical protein
MVPALTAPVTDFPPFFLPLVDFFAICQFKFEL